MAATRLFPLGCFVCFIVSCGSATGPLRSIGGQVTGLEGGSLILGSADGQSVTVSQNTSFVLPKAVPEGASYSVFVLQAPLGQSCEVANGSGVVGADVAAALRVSCSLAFGYYKVGGSVSGLNQSSTRGLILALDQQQLPIAKNGSFQFAAPLADLAPYAVGIAALPEGQNCQVQGANGYVDAAPIDSISVTCQPSSALFVTIGVSGLLQNSNAAIDMLSIVDVGSVPATSLIFSSQTAQAQTLAKNYTYAAPFALQVLAPSGLQCTWDGAAGAIDGTQLQGVMTGNTALAVACRPIVSYALSLEVTGIVSGVLLASNNQSVDANSPIMFDLTSSAVKTFAYPYSPQQAYQITLGVPAGHSCAPGPQSPALAGLMGANLTVQIACAPSPARLSVGVSGVTRGSVAVSDGLSQDANSSVIFSPADPNVVQSFGHTYLAGDRANLSLSASQLACYFVDNGATTLSPTLLGDTYVRVVCAQTIP